MKTVLMPTLVAAKNVDSYNASFIDTENDIENGAIIAAGDYSEEQVYEVAEVEDLHNLFMVFSPEDTILTDGAGNEYKIGINDPRTFTNVKGKVFSAFRPQVGDKILISAEGIEGDAAEYAVAAAGKNKLQFASAAVDGLSYKVLNDSAYISIGGATAIGSQRVEAYLLECVAI